MDDMPIGLHVRVTTVPLRHGMSLVDVPGRIRAIEYVPIEHDGTLHEMPTPVIQLHNGRDVRGYECWWTRDWEHGA